MQMRSIWLLDKAGVGFFRVETIMKQRELTQTGVMRRY